MNPIKEDLLLHPVRLRILLAVAGRQVTAQQLVYELKDIPQATLYRNINTLAAAGMLKVVRERRVHNRLEKTYAVPDEGVMLSPEDLKQAPPEAYMRLFTQYFGLLLSYFTRYLQQGDVDLLRDHVLFQLIPLNLSHNEALELGKALSLAFQPYLKQEPAPERQRIILGLLSLPDVVSTQAHPISDTETPAAESNDPGSE